MRFICYSLLFISTAMILPADSLAAEADTIWVRTYGGSMSQEGISLRQCADGGYVIAGNEDPGGSYTYYYMARTDSSGNLLWDSTYQGSYWLGVAAAEETADGGFLLTGYEGEMPFSFIYTVRTDQFGSVLWRLRQQGGSMAYTSCFDMVRTSEGYYALAGDYGGDYGCVGYCLVMDDEATTQMETYLGEMHMYTYVYFSSIRETSDGYVLAGRNNLWDTGALVVRISSGGSELWHAVPEGSGQNDNFTCAIELADGSFAAAGYHRDIDDDYDFYFCSMDCDGNILDTLCIGLPDKLEQARDIIQTQDGGLLLAGSRHRDVFSEPDIYLVKLDPTGGIQWECVIGGPGYDAAGEIMELAEDTYLLAGTTTAGADGRDVLLMKFMVTDEGVGQGEGHSPGALPQLSCFPNPCSSDGCVSITLSCDDPVSLSAFDFSGRLLARPATTLGPGAHTMSWGMTDDDGRPLPEGVYTLTARSSSGISSRRLVVLQ